MTYKKKLIEVALPLDAINGGCAQEKNPFLKGHPRSTHLWWARRPLAAARAVLFAQMIDDPSSHPELFTTIEAQETERKRLFSIIEELVKWENIGNKSLLDEAYEEIHKSWRLTCAENKDRDDLADLFNPDKIPAVHDPFAGGGAIPLEVQRLGLEAYASDLNPVAVMINKAMIDIPVRFADQAPVHPETRSQLLNEKWEDARGLAEDVRCYGKWLKKKAFEKIGDLYPKIKDSNGVEHTVIAWIWTRTVKCPNPACGCEMPLASSFELSKKKGKEAYVQPIIEGKNIRYEVRYGKGSPEAPKMGRGAKFRCLCCGEMATPEYIKAEANAVRMGAALMGVVAEGTNGRMYLPADEVQTKVAVVDKPEQVPHQPLANDPRNIWCTIYGLDTFDKLFTNRQLLALMTFSELVAEVRTQVKSDGGSPEYAKAVCLYLAFGISQLARYSCTICGWNKTNENVAQAFGRQAIPMVWDYAEANPFEGPLSITSTIEWPVSVIQALGKRGFSEQADAQNQKISRKKIVSTDPPYYDNISYADLSDFFYLWLRHSLRGLYPELFATMATPKEEELVAAPYRHGGKEAAEKFFLDGMYRAMDNLAQQIHPAYPMTLYYAYKQSDNTRDGEVSRTGWETFLEAVLRADFTITGTWPIRTERTKGLKGEVNALASSIVLVCRKRSTDAPICTRRDFLTALKRELRPAIVNLQQSNIAPVDMAQSAIGPGMAVYSRYAQVLEADGTPMTVRTALQIINQELDQYFSEQDGALDRDTIFCVALYTQFAFREVKFGDVDVLARAKNTSTDRLREKGILFAERGTVRLLQRDEIASQRTYDVSVTWQVVQRLAHALDVDGVEGAAQIVVGLSSEDAEKARALAYRLFQTAERRGWAQEAYAYNTLVTNWRAIQEVTARIKKEQGTNQGGLFTE